MKDLYNFFLHVYASLPPEVGAMGLAWAVSVSITQPLKFLWPFHWHPKLRELLSWCLAFSTAFTTMVLLVPTNKGALLGLIVGIWSPVAYAITIKLIGAKFPLLKDILSGDVRGTLRGVPTEKRE